MKEKLYICLVSSSLYPVPAWSYYYGYGSESIVYYLLNELERRGYKVDLIAPQQSIRPKTGKLYPIPCSYGEIDYDCELKAYEWYYDEIKNVDIIHDLSSTCVLSERIYYYHNLKPPFIITRNGIDFTRPRGVKINIVVLSEYAKKCALEGINSAFYGVPGFEYIKPIDWLKLKDVRVVYYGIPEDLYQFESNKEDYILFVGRTHISKGIDLILEVAKLLPNERFIICTRPARRDHFEYLHYYMLRSKEMGLRNVEFYIHKSGFKGQLEKIRLYQKAKCFLSPNIYVEALGLASIESMMCGTPVIVSDRGAGREIVNDRVGYVVPIEKVNFNLQRILEEIKKGIKYCEELDYKEVREYCVKRFSSRVMCDNYLRLYYEVIEKGGIGWGL